MENSPKVNATTDEATQTAIITGVDKPESPRVFRVARDIV